MSKILTVHSPCGDSLKLEVGGTLYPFPSFYNPKILQLISHYFKCFTGRRVPATPQPPWLQYICLRVLPLELVSSCEVVIASRHGCRTRPRSPVIFLTRNATQVYCCVAEEEPIKSSVSVSCPSHKKAPSLLHTLWSNECSDSWELWLQMDFEVFYRPVTSCNFGIFLKW